MIEYYECMFCGYIDSDQHYCENCGSDDMLLIENEEDDSEVE